MAKKINAKLVLELLGKGMSAREIYRTRRISQQSVKKVREAAEERGVTWADVSDMGEADVYDLLFPAQAEARAAVAEVTTATCTRSSRGWASTRSSSGTSTGTLRRPTGART